jgi:clan AA aspartic protease
MITGKVSQGREAIVEIEVSGPGGQWQPVEFVIDTGFTGQLLLPPQLVSNLQLLSLGVRRAVLGDGSAVVMTTYRASVIWHGHARPVIVLEASGAPLIGMGLLEGSRVTIEAAPGGVVAIEELP